jgi:uncharacterized membrane protein YdjX (TVP38/TMEM64 family)
MIVLLAATGTVLTIGLIFTPKADLLDAVRDHALAWRTFSLGHPIAAAAAFTAAYAAAVTAMLPVALVLTAVSGLLFGGLLGASLSIAGAALGALSAYGLAWTASLRTARRHRKTLQRVVAAIRANTFACVLSLRLIPLTPFTIVSMAAGLARTPLPAFLGATVLGVAPESAVYAWIGAGVGDSLARGGSLRLDDLAHPALLFGLTGLGLLFGVGALFRALGRARARPKPLLLTGP